MPLGQAGDPPAWRRVRPVAASARTAIRRWAERVRRYLTSKLAKYWLTGRDTTGWEGLVPDRPGTKHGLHQTPGAIQEAAAEVTSIAESANHSPSSPGRATNIEGKVSTAGLSPGL